MDAERGPKQALKACKTCGRTFVPESLVKHQKVCKDAQKVKRKPFDMAKQRATDELSAGQIKKAQKKVKHAKTCKKIQEKRKPFDTAKQRVTEDLSLRQIKAAQRKAVAPPKSHWRDTHREFIQTIRSAKGVQHALDTGGPLPPPPPPAANLDYIQCNYCGRRFNEKAAERHINFCKEQVKKLPASKKPISDQAMKRAEAKKYKPPKPMGRGDTPPMSGGSGYGRGGYSDSPPAGRGGYSSGPTAKGGYSSGYSNSPAARGQARAGPEMSRAPGSGGVGGGYSSRGRAPAGGPTVRGRPSPSTQTGYADILSAGDEYNNNSYEVACHDLFLPSRTGPKLRSGREFKTSDLNSSASRHRKDDTADSPKLPSKVALQVHRTMTESGYCSSNSDLDIYGTSMTTNPAGSPIKSSMSTNSARSSIKSTPTTPSASRFCHECGSKFPVPSAKFCCECGIRRITC